MFKTSKSVLNYYIHGKKKKKALLHYFFLFISKRVGLGTRHYYIIHLTILYVFSSRIKLRTRRYVMRLFDSIIVLVLTTLMKLMRLNPCDQPVLDLFAQLFGSALTALVPPIPRNALAYTVTASNISNAFTYRNFSEYLDYTVVTA